MIVIDVGCARYGGDYSIERLIEQFEPTHLYGFDPHSSIPTEFVRLMGGRIDVITGEPIPPAGPSIHLERAAAWTYDGKIGYYEDGLNSWITTDPNAPKVRCVDLARVIEELYDRHEERIVLKLDCEGCEYEVLKHLIIKGVDELLDVVVVEWHPKTVENAENRRRVLEEELNCEVQEWPY